MDDAARIPCSVGDGTVCGAVHHIVGNEQLARMMYGGLDTVLRVVLIVVLGLMTIWFVRRIISRLTSKIATGELDQRLGARQLREVLPWADDDGLRGERRAQRAKTIGQVLRSISTLAIFSVVTLMALDQLGINLAPLITGAGIAGVALGFGAQTLVRDFLSGLFMVMEDQYGLGDTVDLGEVTGVIERVGFRVTTVRDITGTLWYVRNGEIVRVGNKSQSWAQVVLDVPVPAIADMDTVVPAFDRALAEFRDNPLWSTKILDDGQVLGVEQLDRFATTVRVTVRVKPEDQWMVGRALRRQLLDALQDAGIDASAMMTVAGETEPM